MTQLVANDELIDLDFDVILGDSRMNQLFKELPPDVKDMTEEDLLKQFNPTNKDFQIRRKIWEQIGHSNGNRKIKIVNIIRNCISTEQFYKKIKDPYRLAYYLSPRSAYDDITHNLLDKIMGRYNDLINMEITVTKFRKNNETGLKEEFKETCPKKAQILLSTIRNLEDRVKGAPIAKQINVNTSTPKLDEEEEIKINMDTVNSRIEELELKLLGKGVPSEEIVTEVDYKRLREGD